MKRFNLILPILCVLATGYAQTIEKKNYEVHVNYPGFSVKAVVLNEDKKIATKEELTYSWYLHNTIQETKGGYDGRLLDGEYTALYLNNNLKEKGGFNKGLKDGKWTGWYENGNIQEITTWKNGLRNGKHSTFDLNGNKILESNYDEGLLDGDLLTYENGKVVSRRQYDDGVEIPTAAEGKGRPDEATTSKKDKKSWQFWKKKKDKAQDS